MTQSKLMHSSLSSSYHMLVRRVIMGVIYVRETEVGRGECKYEVYENEREKDGV
jgi:hypothetical protein